MIPTGQQHGSGSGEGLSYQILQRLLGQRDWINEDQTCLGHDRRRGAIALHGWLISLPVEETREDRSVFWNRLHGEREAIRLKGFIWNSGNQERTKKSCKQKLMLTPITSTRHHQKVKAGHILL